MAHGQKETSSLPPLNSSIPSFFSSAPRTLERSSSVSEALELLSEDMSSAFSFSIYMFLSVGGFLKFVSAEKRKVSSLFFSSSEEKLHRFSLVRRRERASGSLRFLSSAMTLWVLCQVRGPVEVTNKTTSKAQRKHGRFLSSCPSERNSRPRPLKNHKNPSQAALLVTNGLAVLNNDRCLEKCKDAFNFEVGKGKTGDLESFLAHPLSS